MSKIKKLKLPNDMDPECIKICEAMNRLPGIQTVESCCGHDEHPFWIFFKADNLEVLPELLYWFDRCHSGVSGWQIVVSTDCAMSPVTFCAEGPIGQEAYDGANKIAEYIEKDLML